MWNAIVSKLVGSFAPEVVGYYKRKAELKQEVKLAKIRGKLAQQEALAKRASESEGRDHDWELESIRNSGWKDELVLLVLTIPMVLVFVPPLQPYIAIGFNNLEMTPDWYRWLVMMIYAATFGIRIWRRKL